MPIDPSIPLQAGKDVPQLDVLGTMGKVQSYQNAQLQNKLGTVQLETNEQELATTRIRALGAIAGAALSQYDPNNPNAFVHALHNGIEHGRNVGAFDTKTAQALIGGIASTKDIGTLVAQTKQYALMGIDPNAALSRVYGQPGNMTNGQDLQPGVVRDPMMGGGFTPSGPAVPQYPSRGELAARVTGPVDPITGAPTTVPLGTVTPPNLSGAAGSAIPNGGRMPSALLNPANAPPPITGVVATGLGPAAAATASARGTASAGAFQRYSEEGVNAKSQDAILANMLAEADQFGTGFAQDRVKNVHAFFQRVGDKIGIAFPGVNPHSLAANEGFDKLAAQIANAQGAGSDARMAVNQHANPSSSLSPEGIKQIIGQLRGNADYMQARQKLAAAHPDKADREGFEANVASKLDPRVFQYARLTPDQRRTYAAGISAADKPAFARAYRFAEEQGLLNGGR